MNGGTLADERAIALQDADLVMETLREWQFDNPGQPLNPAPPVAGVTWAVWLRDNVKNSPATGARMLLGENVQVTAAAAANMSAGLQQVTVRVTWTGRGGAAGITLVNFFMSYPINT